MKMNNNEIYKSEIKPLTKKQLNMFANSNAIATLATLDAKEEDQD